MRLKRWKVDSRWVAVRQVCYLDGGSGTIGDEYDGLTLTEKACLRKVLKEIVETLSLDQISTNLYKDYGEGLHGIRCERVRLYFCDRPDGICLLLLSKGGKGGQRGGKKRQDLDIDRARQRRLESQTLLSIED